MSVNVSKYNFYRANLVALFTDLIAKYELRPGDLQLEITETACAEDTEQIYAVIRQLQQAGFTVLMDDFGAGYSSLNMFKDAPVDIIKLDMGFISSDENNAERSGAVIASIVNLSHSLNIPVIVEGVETQAQMCIRDSSSEAGPQSCRIGSGKPAQRDDDRIFDPGLSRAGL